MKEDIFNICSLEYSRMGSSKTQDSETKPLTKHPRNAAKDLKLKYKSGEKLQPISSENGELKEMGDIEIKVEGSINKGEDYRTTTINFISIN